MSSLAKALIVSSGTAGTVTNISAGTGITLTPNPITTTGTIALTIPVTIADGGTNATTMTNTDGVVYYDGTRLVTTTVGTASQVLTSNGAGNAPTFQSPSPSGITLNVDDNGSVTGTTLDLYANSGSASAGSTVNFIAVSGTEIDLQVSDTNNNTIIGLGSGNASVSGSSNTGLGNPVFQSLTSGTNNSAFGSGALDTLADASNNSAFGQGSLQQLSTGEGSNTSIGLEAGFQLTSGANNTFLGFATGYNYTGAESNNICIGTYATELAGENNTLRIGAGTGTDPFTLNQAYISGINGNTLSGTPSFVVIDPITDQLGVSSGSGGGIITIDVDKSGSVTGSTIDLFANSGSASAGSTVFFTAASATEIDLQVTDANGSTIIGRSTGNASLSGQQNTGVGFQVLQGLTSGSNNYAFGYNCLNVCAGGSGNIGIGSGCGNGTVATNFSTYMGYDAGLSNDGGFNTLIGFFAAPSMLTGSHNVILTSYEGGMNWSGSESNNITIGEAPGTAGDNNVLAIGNGTGTGQGQLNSAYIAGINSNAQSYNTGGINVVTINSSGDQLGVKPITDGSHNTIIGNGSGNATASNQNTVLGSNSYNTATTDSGGNVAIGYLTLPALSSGAGSNMAVGQLSLYSLTSGNNNVAMGANALDNLLSGSYNLGLGFNSGGPNYTGAESHNISINATSTTVTGESNVLRIGNGTGTGTQQLNAAYIAGIQGITVTGAAVLVSSSDQLGVAVSSRKFKDNIRDMDNYSSAILNLRPTVFNYKGSTDVSSGLIAEEVEQIMPDLVVYDKQGDPQTVKYHELPALLLNELQKALKRIEALEARMGVCCGK